MAALGADAGRDVRQHFDTFAEWHSPGETPLYQHLARRAATDELILDLASVGRAGNAANLLFACVHYMLLMGVDHPLRNCYPSITDTLHRPRDPFPLFRDFCVQEQASLRSLLATRRVQTNEVSRAGALAPALSAIQRRTKAELALVELGTSAGFLLCLDHFELRYSTGECAGPPHRLPLRCDVRGARRPMVSNLEVGFRAGIDISPPDLTRFEDRVWLQSLVWPEHRARAGLLQRAVDLVCEIKPTVITGDMFTDLDKVVAAAPKEQELCIFDVAIGAALEHGDVDALTMLLHRLASLRDFTWVSIEAPGTVPYIDSQATDDPPGSCSIGIVAFRGGAIQDVELVGRTGLNGGWLEWLA